jgi:hypothetical protein
MNCWPRFRFTSGCFSGFTSITPYWLNMRLSPSSALNRDADHHRRQAHQRVEHDDAGLAAGVAGQRHQRAERQADDGRHANRAKADRQGQPNDAKQRRIGAEHELQRGGVARHGFDVPSGRNGGQCAETNGPIAGLT